MTVNSLATGVVLVWLAGPVLALTDSSPAPPPVHVKRFYRAPEGKLYVARDLPVRLSIGLAAEGGESHLLGGVVSAPGPTLGLKEGLNTVQVGIAHLDVYADGTPPRTEFSLTAAPRHQEAGTTWLGRGLKVSLTAADSISGLAGTWLSVDGAKFELMSSTSVEIDREGSHNLRYYSVDNVGNAEPLVSTAFVVDLSPPTSQATILSKREGNVVSPHGLITLSTKDPSSGVRSTSFTLDGGKQQDYIKPLTLEGLTDGEHTLRYYSEDNVGNSEPTQTLTFSTDGSPPAATVSIRGPVYVKDGVRRTAPASEIVIEPSDSGAGLLRVRYSVDGEGERDYQGPFALSARDGIRRVRYEVTDRVDNVLKGAANDIYRDSTPPSTEYELSGSFYRRDGAMVINAETRVTLSAVDLESGVREITYDLGAGFQPYRGPITIPQEGEYSLRYNARDNVNNTEEARVLALRVDNSPRRLTPPGPPASAPKQWHVREGVGVIGAPSLPFSLRISASPEEGAPSYLLDPGDVEASARIPLLFDEPGAGSLSVGIAARKLRFAVPIDGAPPMTRAVFGGARKYVAGNALFYGPGLTVTLDAADEAKGISSGLAKIVYSVDGSPFGTYRRALAEFSIERLYSIRYYAIDNVGNTEAVHQAEYTIDTTPPRTRHVIDGPFDGNTISPSTRLALQSSDNLAGVAELRYRFDTAPEQTYRVPLTGERLSAGSHTLTYYGVDNVGNREEARSFTFRVDRTAPSVTLRASGGTHENAGVFWMRPGARLLLGSAAETELASFQYQIDSGAPSPYQSPIAAPEGSGRHSLAYWAVDRVGNASPKRTLTLAKDDAAPESQARLDGPAIERPGRMSIGARTRIVLDSSDAESGVAGIEYAVDGGAWRAYAGPFTIPGGRHILSHRAHDRVGNVGVPRKLDLVVDTEGPLIEVTYSVEPRLDRATGLVTIPASALMFVSAEDAMGALEEITYRIGDGRDVVYRTPLSGFTAGSSVSVTIVASDQVGNKRVRILKLRVE
jgi:hypothetical protein